MKKGCCNNDTKYFASPNAGLCDMCHPTEAKVSPLEAAATCPPIGEPKLLTMMAPVVFDECGINLCRTVCVDDLQDVCSGEPRKTPDIIFSGLTKCDLLNANKLQLQVVDIDFNFVDPCGCRFSEIQPAKNKANLTRITLKDIDVTFAVTVLDDRCRVTNQGMMTVRYLGDERSDYYDSCTNPSSICFDLYTPYGLAFAPENPLGCNKLVPTINFLGYVNSQHGYGEAQNPQGLFEFPVNNTLQQGIDAQALAKVVAYGDQCFVIGLTLCIKSVYFVQYKFKHEGLTIPPKLKPIDGDENSSNCLDFVCGDLLETSIKPLEVGKNATLAEPSIVTNYNAPTSNNNCGCGCNSGCGCGCGRY